MNNPDKVFEILFSIGIRNEIFFDPPHRVKSYLIKDMYMYTNQYSNFIENVSAFVPNSVDLFKFIKLGCIEGWNQLKTGFAHIWSLKIKNEIDTNPFVQQSIMGCNLVYFFSIFWCLKWCLFYSIGSLNLKHGWSLYFLRLKKTKNLRSRLREFGFKLELVWKLY